MSDRYGASDLESVLGDHGCRPLVTYRPLHKLVWGLAEAEGLGLQNDSWVAGVGEHSRWQSHICRSGGLR